MTFTEYLNTRAQKENLALEDWLKNFGQSLVAEHSNTTNSNLLHFGKLLRALSEFAKGITDAERALLKRVFAEPRYDESDQALCFGRLYFLWREKEAHGFNLGFDDQPTLNNQKGTK